MRFYPSAAAAQQAGFRACKRCRPDASPGSPEWNERADLVGPRDAADRRRRRRPRGRRRAWPPARLQHPPDRAAAPRRARRGPARAGPGPACADRPAADRDDALPMADVAFAAGFASIRAVQRHRAGGVRADADRAARRGAAGAAAAAPGTLVAAAAVPRAAADPDNLFGHLGRDRRARRRGVAATARTAAPCALPHGHGIVALRPAATTSRCRARRSTDLRDLAAADQPLPAAARPRRRPGRGRRPARAPTRVLAPLVAKAPGRRVPRTVDADRVRGARGARPAGVHRGGPHPRRPARRRARRAGRRTRPAG